MKKGAPKRLEKMLFINHKEDLLLDDKLHDLKQRSRLKIMELDRERIKIRNELRDSRKKNITIHEAMSSGLLADDNVFNETTVTDNSSKLVSSSQQKQHLHANVTKPLRIREASSAPTQRRMGVVQQPTIARSSTSLQPQTNRKLSHNNQFALYPTIPETDELDLETSYNKTPVDTYSRTDKIDSVGAYVLNEFEKISQVVPDILRALAKKKDQQKERDERIAVAKFRNEKHNINFNAIDYEPDMNKVRKTVNSVKKLRYRMSISKKLENAKPRKSLDEMIRDKTDNVGEYDEYTDGTCALMKRRLEKKRRDSAPVVMCGQLAQMKGSINDSQSDRQTTMSNRRHSMASVGGAQEPSRRMSRSISVVQLPSMGARSSTTMGFGSSNRLNNKNHEQDDRSQFINEDELMKRKRILRELQNYRTLQGKVDRFMVSKIPNCYNKPMSTVFEEVVLLQ